MLQCHSRMVIFRINVWEFVRGFDTYNPLIFIKGFEMQKENSLFMKFAMVFLVCGNLVGAGILALPVQTGLAGFFPTLIGMLVVGGGLFYTSLILAKEAIEKNEETFNYPSLFHHYLGLSGKWIAILANLLILYGLITAYLMGATAIIVNLFEIEFSSKWVLLGFFIVVTGITMTKPIFRRKCNAVLIIVMWITFAMLIFLAEPHVQAHRLLYTDWKFLPATAPIILTAFYFHNIVPYVCHNLKWNFSTVWKVILIGMFISYVMNLLWIHVGIGALPIDGKLSLYQTFIRNQPATIPLAKMIHSSVFVIGALVFTLVALFTSYLAAGIGCLGFIDDLARNHLGLKYKFVSVLMTFAPPLLVSLFYPDLFIKALNIVGGIGVVLLFGILPCIIAIKKTRSRPAKIFAWFMLILFSIFFMIEVGQEIGLLQISPHAEYYAR